MLFNSHIFIFIFLPVVWLGYNYFKSADRQESGIIFLVFSSLVFYGYWNAYYLLLIGCSIVANYGMGLLIEQQGRYKRVWLFIGVAANLTLLAYYKYLGFFVLNYNYFAETPMALESIVLPLAISFFTFQQITYLVDSAKGLTSEHSFWHYCLYVTFFPQLIAGPIVHHKEMLPQFTRRQPRAIQYSDLAIGISIFAMGLFKKVMVADNLAPYAGDVFSHAEAGLPLSAYDAWVGALAYTFQLYFDFSGYADMAIGIARMFSVRLPLNFNSPYKANNIIDFWRRWHMTLSRFLRDYLYIPLGGSRKGRVRRLTNLFVTMLLGGLWHGAGWTFVVWGCLHGIYLMINHGWRSLASANNTEGKERSASRVKQYLLAALSRVLTMLAVVIAWVFFRAADVNSAVEIVMAMLGFSGNASEVFEVSKSLPAIVLLFLWVWLFPNAQELMKKYRPAYDFDSKRSASSMVTLLWRPTLKWFFVVMLMLIIAILNLTQLSEFIYFQF
ncbi:MBOAT family protein [Dasania marina]|uniref:MBOAT family O-acyltransferase n=1 Tax=Dasania marina TaxID=471499 RepID=UPI0030D983DF|tara:strand:- start:48527 stop:50023 length:1497 start_codon:yes stop_codon:yes gene_type:complete